MRGGILRFSENLYHGDKIVAILKLKNPGDAPPPGGRNRVIPGGPLYDLVGLQAALSAGSLDLGKDEHCYVATDTCWNDLRVKLQWETGIHVKRLLLCLRPKTTANKGDFFKSEWCTDGDDAPRDCDVYRIRVDEYDDWKRNPNAPQYYVKFAIEESGHLCLVLISCHLDKP